ncbi:MAG: anhydro-N-acetylmuramic acid kinase [Succinivibrio sp.]|nr:anhydro-N-acetylmuramic acid kinase [Succinivibrio sp.]
MSTLYAIGLMSGTSIDALDAALISYDGLKLKALSGKSSPWPSELKEALHALCTSSDGEVERIGILGNRYAEHAAALIADLLTEAKLKPSQIAVIGSHGQTIRHRPKLHFSYQLDNGPRLAALTGIDTVVDFRSADLAGGGEGAPLTPLFHQAVFAKPGMLRLVLNLGGIANLTVLTAEGEISSGFDCGPANTLCDLCCRRLLNISYDKDALHARNGRIVDSWLSELMQHPFLQLKPPKSTGREDFNEQLISPYLKACKENPSLTDSLLRTLTEYTVSSAVEAILGCTAGCRSAELILCGGGALNPLMVKLFQDKLAESGCQVYRAEDFGVSSQFLEPQAFAYFALQCMLGHRLDLTHVTGASQSSILGCLCPAVGGRYEKLMRSINLKAQD